MGGDSGECNFEMWEATQVTFLRKKKWEKKFERPIESQFRTQVHRENHKNSIRVFPRIPVKLRSEMTIRRTPRDSSRGRRYKT